MLASFQSASQKFRPAQSKKHLYMSNPFTHPSGEKLLDVVKKIYSSPNIFERKDRHIIFVCGGSMTKHSRSMRKRFLRYSNVLLTDYRFFLAESATQDFIKHNDPEFINIADFESIIADIADCILLFPESPGSIAEAGYFSNSSQAIKKLLIANDSNKQDDSFINIGIVEKANRLSNFRSVIIIDYNHPDFSPIGNRLTKRLPSKKSKNINPLLFQKLSYKEKLYIIYETISIFIIITFDTLVYCIEYFFGKSEIKILKQLTSILIAANYITRIGENLDHFCISSSVNSFLDFRGVDLQRLRAKIINFYKTNHTGTFELIQEVSHDY